MGRGGGFSLSWSSNHNCVDRCCGFGDDFSVSREIEDAIKQDDWKRARRLARAALRREPESHWLLTRLALTYYEEFDYERALVIGQQAYELAPHCPLVLWGLGGTLDTLGRHSDAAAIFQGLIRRGVETVAYGDCGEGLAWSRGLIADCWYRLAHCEQKLGHRARTIRCYQQHLAMRGPGCRSIYPLSEVRREFRDLPT
jgi:tetratricopeptide (TPR) repeat protein